MVRTLKKNIVDDFRQAAENIKRYHEDLATESRLVARMSRHPAWYAVRDDDGRWFFGPSKFVGYTGTAQQYVAHYDRAGGGDTERLLADWFDPVDPETVLGRELQIQFRQFFSSHGKRPHKLSRISIPKDAFGTEISSKTRPAGRTRTLADRISVNPQICGGRPCVRGTRVRVSDILDMIAHDMSPAEIVRDYPYLNRSDVAAALAYAADAVDHRVVKAA